MSFRDLKRLRGTIERSDYTLKFEMVPARFYIILEREGGASGKISYGVFSEGDKDPSEEDARSECRRNISELVREARKIDDETVSSFENHLSEVERCAPYYSSAYTKMRAICLNVRSFGKNNRLHQNWFSDICRRYIGWGLIERTRTNECDAPMAREDIEFNGNIAIHARNGKNKLDRLLQRMAGAHRVFYLGAPPDHREILNRINEIFYEFRS